MKKLISLLAVALVVFAACTKENKDEQQGGGSIIGGWSSGEAGQDDSAIAVHFNFREDGTFDAIIPHWEEGRYGSYSIKGDVVTCEVNKLEWLWGRGSGYKNVYDQYDCWYADSEYFKPDEERKKFNNPHNQWTSTHSEEAKFSFKFAVNGKVATFEAISGYCPGLDFGTSFYSHPDYKPAPDKQ